MPFGTGTSVFYNNVDYRVRNDTGDTYQYRVWLEEEDLCGEQSVLTAQAPFSIPARR